MLIDRGYSVFGTTRGGSAWRLEALGIVDRLTLLRMDAGDERAAERIVAEVRPDEIYNLAAISSVRESFDRPLEVSVVNGLATVRLLEAMRGHAPSARFYQASSSEMLGGTAGRPHTGATLFAPRSPYAVAKAYAHQMTVAYREAYGLFACCGILFNHESPMRGEEFVTRKIAASAARISLGCSDSMVLGNVEARRDFGYAPEYVEAMAAMLQCDRPVDCVVATGEAHSIREFAEAAFARLGLDLDEHLIIDRGLLRPAEPELIVGDPEQARRLLGWTARTRFADLVRILVDAEVERCRRVPEVVRRP